MPNPHPTFFTTGNRNSREALQREVQTLRALNYNWTEIGRELGISDRTAKRIHDEAEATRKEARAVAYAAAERLKNAPAFTATQTGLKPAAVLYAGLLLLLLIVATALVIHH